MSSRLASSLTIDALPGALPRLRRLGPLAGLVAGAALVGLGFLLIAGLTDPVLPAGPTGSAG